MVSLNIKSKIYLLSVFILLKSLWLFSEYNIAPDISNQMNVSENLFNNRGLNFGNTTSSSTFLSPYFQHPPGTSLLLCFFRSFTSDVFWADYLLRIFIALIEALLAMSFFQYFARNKLEFLLLFVTSSFYIGHIDRGQTGDYLSCVTVVILMWLLYAILLDRYSPLLISLLVSIVIIIIPVVKYTAAPTVLLPLLFYVYLFYKKKIRKNNLWLIITSFFIAVSLSAYFIKSSHGVVERSAFSLQKFENLARIDYFWLHLGHTGDRIWKLISWNSSQVIDITVPYYHIAQIGTILALLFLIYWSRISINFKHPLLIVIFCFTILQVIYLAFLTLTNNPQIGTYGIDRKIWVFIEEARYYNHLTLVIFWSILVLLLRRSKLIFTILALICIISFSLSLSKIRSSRLPIIITKYHMLLDDIPVDSLIMKDQPKETENIERRVIGIKN